MRRLGSGLACHALLWCWVAAAEQAGTPGSLEPGKVPSDTPPDVPVPPVQEKPWTIYMVDKDGKLVPMINWTIETFDEIHRFWKGLKQPEQAPRYVLESMSATGVAEQDRAELTVQFKIRVRDDNWTRVPLRLNEALLLPGGDPYRGPGEHFLEFEEGGEGHVVWIRGPPEKQHELTLKVWVPLTEVGDENQLRLSVPRPRPAVSELKLTVPTAGAEGDASVGDVDAKATPSPSANKGGGTEFTVLGLEGDFEFTWRPKGRRRTAVLPVLEAEGAIIARVASDGATIDADLTVVGHGAPFDRFLVRLPQGAELVSGSPAGYTVSIVRNAESGEDEAVLEVQRNKRLRALMQVQLTTRQSQNAADEAGSFELGGFEVIGAIQQRGFVGVSTSGDRAVRLIEGRGVRQVDQLPEALQKELQNENVVGRFQYFSQPFSLTARVVEVTTSVRVKPEYRIWVEEDRARLEADLVYTIRGGETSRLNVGLPGWQLDKDGVGPDNVVAVDDATMNPSGVLSIRLRQPSTGQIQVSIRAHQLIDGDTTSPISLALPQPKADSLAPADVLVIPADNVELVPDDRMKGLVRHQVPPPSQRQLFKWQQGPLYYQADTSDAEFLARLKVHPRRVTVDIASEVAIQAGQAAVHQTLTYEIAYEQLDKLRIEVPPSLAKPDQLTILLDGEQLSPTTLSDQADQPEALGPVSKWLVLPTARIGPCKLEVSYVQPIPSGEVGRDDSVRIPLVMPGGGELPSDEVELLSNVLLVTTPESITVEPRNAPWTISQAPAGNSPRRNGVQLSADGRASEVVLGIRREGREATVVQRAWVQTWWTRTDRRERAVFRLTSDLEQLELILPAGVDPNRLQVFLGRGKTEDRQSLNVQMTPDHRVRIALPEDSGDRPLVLEAWYHFSSPRPAWGRLSIDLPRLGGEVWVRRMYWQVVFPRNEHVIVGPKGFTPEFKWGWNGLFWGRIPLMEQSELEAWCGATGRGDEVPSATSRYLFSRWGPVQQCELRTASRWLIVLGASSVVLAVGLSLIYVPQTRHPAGLLAVAVLLLAAALVYPEPTLLALQAASLGLALAFVAALLHRILARGPHGLRRSEAFSSVLSKGSTQVQSRPPVAGNQASTESAPAPLSMPSPGSNS